MSYVQPPVPKRKIVVNGRERRFNQCGLDIQIKGFRVPQVHLWDPDKNYLQEELAWDERFAQFSSPGPGDGWLLLLQSKLFKVGLRFKAPTWKVCSKLIRGDKSPKLRRFWLSW